jgi:hypothetical protein
MKDKNNPRTLGNQEKDLLCYLEVFKDLRKRKTIRKTPRRLNQH